MSRGLLAAPSPPCPGPAWPLAFGGGIGRKPQGTTGEAAEAAPSPPTRGGLSSQRAKKWKHQTSALFPPWPSNWDQGQGTALVIQKRALETSAQLVTPGGKSGRKLHSDQCYRCPTEPRPALVQVLPALLVSLLHRWRAQPLHQSTLQPAGPGRGGPGAESLGHSWGAGPVSQDHWAAGPQGLSSKG